MDDRELRRFSQNLKMFNDYVDARMKIGGCALTLIIVGAVIWALVETIKSIVNAVSENGAVYLLVFAVCLLIWWLRLPYIMKKDVIGDARAAHKAYKQTRKKLGKKHPDTIAAMEKAANEYLAIDLYRPVCKLLKPVYKARRKALGAEHPDTVQLLRHMATAQAGRRKFKKAYRLFKKVYTIRNRIGGVERDEMIVTLVGYSAVCARLKKKEQALAAQEKMLGLVTEIYEEICQESGVDSADALMAKTYIAITYYNMDQLDKALEIHEEIYAKRREMLGDQHEDTKWSQQEIAAIQKKMAKK